MADQKGYVQAVMDNLKGSIPQGAQDFFLGTPGRNLQLSKLNQPQQNLQQRLLESIDPEVINKSYNYAPIKQEAYRNFATQELPALSQRWYGPNGASMGRPGKNFADVEANALSNFKSKQDYYESLFNAQKGDKYLNLISTLMNPSNENIYMPREPGFIEKNAPGGAANALTAWNGDESWYQKLLPGILSTIGGFVLGQPGGQLGQWLGSRFNQAFGWTGDKIRELFSKIAGINSSGQQLPQLATGQGSLPTFSQYLDTNVKR